MSAELYSPPVDLSLCTRDKFMSLEKVNHAFSRFFLRIIEINFQKIRIFHPSKKLLSNILFRVFPSICSRTVYGVTIL